MRKPKTLKDFRNHPFVDSVSVETISGDGYFIYLKEPYFCDAMELPSIHEYTLKECAEMFEHVSVNQKYWESIK